MAEREMASIHPNGAQTGTECAKPLIWFVGGFCDILTGPISKWTYPAYRDGEGRGQDVRFVSHDGQAEIVKFSHACDGRDRKIAVVGHSWGGKTAVGACRQLARLKRDIALLVTLDPVSRLGARPDKPENVGKWVNIYVNYSKVPPNGHPEAGFANMVARWGGPWEYCAAADENHEYGYYGGDAHARAWEMFDLVKRDVARIGKDVLLSAYPNRAIASS